MQTQITCPNCQTPYSAEVFQVADVGRQPELKAMLLSGYLNTGQCPVCQAVTQVATPLLYHDPEYELFMVHVPVELGLNHTEQEQAIGRLVRQAMDNLPPEERRGYMFQPQIMLSYQSLLERVLETEGITPEMIQRQRSQVDLLHQLLESRGRDTDQLIEEHDEDIDEVFFAMLRSMMEAADKNRDDSETLKYINLQAKLYQKSSHGQLLERQQAAVRALGRDAKKDGGVSPALLLKHVLANRKDQDIVEALVMAALPALNYEFFLLLSERIDKRKKSGIDARELVELRDRLLQLQDETERKTKEIFGTAQSTLNYILESSDQEKAVREKMGEIDDTFMYLLASSLQQALENNNPKFAKDLETIERLIVEEVDKQSPPELRLLNNLLRAESEPEIRQLIQENKEMMSPELLQLMRQLEQEAKKSGNKELENRLAIIQSISLIA